MGIKNRQDDQILSTMVEDGTGRQGSRRTVAPQEEEEEEKKKKKNKEEKRGFA
jgi:hypothetical protein